MADDTKTDIVMMFWLNNRPVEAECGLEIDKNDTLMSDFRSNPECYFEVSNFDFSLKLEEDELSETEHKEKEAATTGGSFSRWYQYGLRDPKRTVYPAKFYSGGFDRVLDCASPTFFQACCNKKSFTKAILVKRISPGVEVGVTRNPLGYLKLEFRDVIIKSISWEDGDLVTEKCEFDCQQLLVTYRKQSHPGVIGADGDIPASWKAPVKSRQGTSG
jgi:type VI protein secretion system component Hcp